MILWVFVNCIHHICLSELKGPIYSRNPIITISLAKIIWLGKLYKSWSSISDVIPWPIEVIKQKVGKTLRNLKIFLFMESRFYPKHNNKKYKKIYQIFRATEIFSIYEIIKFIIFWLLISVKIYETLTEIATLNRQGFFEVDILHYIVNKFSLDYKRYYPLLPSKNTGKLSYLFISGWCKCICGRLGEWIINL